MKKIRIPLSPAKDELVLIVETSTGVYYTNQVGGMACLHPDQEGFIIPIRIDCRPPLTIPDVFNPDVWYHGVYGVEPSKRLDKPPAFEIYKKYAKKFDCSIGETQDDKCFQWAKKKIETACKKIFKGFGYGDITVSDLLVVPADNNYEAWMHCRVKINDMYHSAILTWHNCD